MIEGLKTDGMYVLGDFVGARRLGDILGYLHTKKMYDPYRPEKPGFTDPLKAHKEALTGYYNTEDAMRTPHLLEMANDPRILNVMEASFGCKPTISHLSIWWSFAGFDPAVNADIIGNPDVYHRDLDDWAQIKLFVYLTDVTGETGPHAFIRGSHRECQYVDRKDAEVKATDPDGSKLVLFSAKAGTGFLERSSTLHRGVAPTKGPRLMLHVTYSLFPLPYVPKSLRPFECDLKGLDPYINRIFFRQGKPAARAERQRKKAA
jgi:hypothetical protein